MANREDNLVPFTSGQSHDEAVENGRKGGLNSGKARRDKRDARERMKLLLSLAFQVKGQNVPSPITGKPMSVGEAIDTAIIGKAVKGDIKAANTVYELLGLKSMRTEVTGAGGEPLIPSSKIDISSLSNEQLEALASIRIKKDEEER